MVNLRLQALLKERLTIYQRIIICLQPPCKELSTLPFLSFGINRQARKERNHLPGGFQKEKGKVYSLNGSARSTDRRLQAVKAQPLREDHMSARKRAALMGRLQRRDPWRPAWLSGAFKRLADMKELLVRRRLFGRQAGLDPQIARLARRQEQRRRLTSRAPTGA